MASEHIFLVFELGRGWGSPFIDLQVIYVNDNNSENKYISNRTISFYENKLK